EDHELRLRQRTRVVGGRDARGEVAAARDTQAVAFERLRVLGPPRQHGDVGDAREMAREEAADRAGAGDADAGHRRHRQANSRPFVRPVGRTIRTSAISAPTTITRVPAGRSIVTPRIFTPFSASARNESSALTASAPTTAPHRLVAPPITSIASVINVRSR